MLGSVTPACKMVREVPGPVPTGPRPPALLLYYLVPGTVSSVEDFHRHAITGPVRQGLFSGRGPPPHSQALCCLPGSD